MCLQYPRHEHWTNNHDHTYQEVGKTVKIFVTGIAQVNINTFGEARIAAGDVESANILLIKRLPCVITFWGYKQLP